jgi:hypothetical protein
MRGGVVVFGQEFVAFVHQSSGHAPDVTHLVGNSTPPSGDLCSTNTVGART